MRNPSSAKAPSCCLDSVELSLLAWQKVFWKKASESRNLLQSRRCGDATSKVFGAAQQESKGLGEITGRSVVVRAAVAAEPSRRRIDAPDLHPLFPSLCSVVSQIKGVPDFMCDVIGQHRDIVLRAGIDFNSMLSWKRHRAKAGTRRHEHDLVSQLLPWNGYQLERRLRPKWLSNDVRGRHQTERDNEKRPNAAHGLRRII